MGLWFIILLTTNVPEGKTELTFHLISEFSMALVCLISGIRILKRLSAQKLNIIGHSMVIYSTLNATGYYFQRNEPVMALLLMVFFIISAAIIIYYLKNMKIQKNDLFSNL